VSADQKHVDPVAIIGIGCLFPKADGPGAYWANICDRVDAVGDVPSSHWRPEDYVDRDPKAPDKIYTARGAFLDPVAFPPLEFGITPNALEATDTTQLLGLMVARQALADAGYVPPREFDRNKVSVILGVTGALELVIPLGARLGHPRWRKALKEAGVADDVAEQVVQKIADSYVGWQEDSFPGLLGNVAAGRIANRLDLGGTNCVVDAACASSLGAIHLALLELAAGRADMVVSGGLDTFNDIFMYTCFSKTPALSPTGNARPFDAKADGTILGEGLGVVILKRYADARRDGDRVYALIRSVGSSSDGKGNAIYAPSPAGQMKALRQAYTLAGVTPDTIELIEAHGTGTRAGDAAELSALAEVYRAAGKRPEKGSWCALGSVKSQIGHTKAAAGIAGLIKAALALHHKVLPPTLKVSEPAELARPGRGPFYANIEKRPWMPAGEHPRRAAVSSFGFGGSNFHCVLEEAQPGKGQVSWDGNVQILAFSGTNREEIRAQLAQFPAAETWNDVRAAALPSRDRFSPTHACRLVMVVEKDKPIAAALANARAALDRFGDRAQWSTPDRIYFGSGATSGKLAFLFPGQGSQYVGMMRDLTCQFPQMLESLAEADAAGNVRVSERIYPLPAFDEETKKRDEETLRATDIAQPALGALAAGALGVLAHFGLKPDMTAGHSYGELVALFAAGRIDATALHRLSRLRGQLMAAESRGAAGAMLAVRAPLAQIEAVLSEEKLDVTIANRNAPSQNVLSGSVAAIERASEALTRRSIATRRLPVSAAFHSPLVAKAREPFLAALADIQFRTGTVPVFANTTGRPYPEKAEQFHELLAGQLAQPVAFVDEITALHTAGCRTFVEVGPGSVLTGLVASILEGRDHVAVAVDASGGKRPGQFDLACVLAQLAALGHTVELKRWDETAPRSTASGKPGLTVPLCGANYVKERPSANGGTKASRVPEASPKRPEKALPAAPPPVAQAAPSMPAAPSKRPAETTPAAPPPVVHAMSSAPGAPALPLPAPVISQEPKPMSESPRIPVSGASQNQGATAEALRMTQDNLVALQRLGEQTAQLHRQFLDGQDRVLGAFQSLLDQQQRLLQASLGMTPAPAPSLPAPVAITPPPLPAPRPAPSIAPPPALPTPVPAPSERITVVTPVQTPSAPPPPMPAASSVPSAATTDTLLKVVSEKTGYPPEMLELDMELDSDLGIDSIKRVEIFSALQERLPEAPVVKPEHLGTLRTLRHVVEFLGDSAVGSPTPPQASVPQQPPATPAAAVREDLTQTLLGVVSEKTGYPPEMLELDMELDSDLGIDSIKRVEIFSAIQERVPEAPVVKPEHLGTLRTLRQVVEFLGLPSTPGEPEKSVEPAAAASTPQGESSSPGNVSAVHRYVLTRQPLAAGNRRPLTLSDKSEIWISEDGVLAGSLAGRLGALGHRCRVISMDQVRTLTPPAQLGGLIVLAPPGEIGDRFMADAFRLLQMTGPALRQAGKDGAALFATVARLDGAFGLDAATGVAISGGLAGLVKTAAREWPEVHCRALDLSAAFVDADEAALTLAEELLHAGPIEVGITPQARHTLSLNESPLPAGQRLAPIHAGDVVVISGGARGVTAAVAVALARAWHPTLILLGRSPEPGSEPAWLAPLREENEIKRALLTQAGGKVAPRALEEQYQQIVAAREIRATLERITVAGSKASYYSVDVRDAGRVAAILQEVRSKFGPVRGIIHGAGVLADRLILDKTEEQFERVYSTKVAGLRSLLGATSGDELKVLALFSSSTGRFGRVGQADYAVANEVLNKMAQSEARRRPGCRVVSLNWGPWDGGMVTPALRGVFASEGVDVIPLEAGARYLIDELSQTNDRAVEIVVLGGELGALEKLQPTEKAIPAVAAGETSAPTETLVTSFERDVSVENFPVLRSHVIDGRAVVPMALMLELLAHGALHRNPGLAFGGFDGMRVLKGIRVKADETRRIRVLAGKARRQEGIYRVAVEMHGCDPDQRDFLHARAEILLGESAPAAPPAANVAPPSSAAAFSPQVMYEQLFHGPDLHGVQQVEHCTTELLTAIVSTAPPPAAWIRQPLRNAWLADPLVLDCAFHLMTYWSHRMHGAFSLPCHAASYRQFRRAFPRGSMRLVSRITRMTGQTAEADIDFLDSDGRLVARLEGYECVLDASLAKAFRHNPLPSEALAT
jgi:acyl transferase domain-containing protein/NAD(P)-dependent dehydrogenase (short-subunit alcohol dehydrogenase family)/acyl carrier protein